MDKHILLKLKITPKLVNAPKYLECYFTLPPEGMVLFSCDGASKGNPGKARWGFVIREHTGKILGAMAGGLGTSTNYVAELKAIVEAMKNAKEMQLKTIWIRTDSEAAAKVCNKGNIHWLFKSEFERLKSEFTWLLITSTWREINFSADACAN
ncbi:hypothetical protein ACHQM5_020833 [Ranunculus cassubicifolius]